MFTNKFVYFFRKEGIKIFFKIILNKSNYVMAQSLKRIVLCLLFKQPASTPFVARLSVDEFN